MSYLSKRQGGFTLLELIVALAVSTLLAVAGAAALSTVIDVYHRSATRTDARESVRASERIIRHEWSGSGQMVKSDGSVLEFETVQPVMGSSAESLSIARVRYSCDRNPVEGFDLTHGVQVLRNPLPTNATDNPFSGGKYKELLATGLKSCAFSFLAYKRASDGRIDAEWVSRWDPSTAGPFQMRLALSGVRADLPAVVYQAQTRLRSR